jgi:hypothetical protein
LDGSTSYFQPFTSRALVLSDKRIDGRDTIETKRLEEVEFGARVEENETQ